MGYNSKQFCEHFPKAFEERASDVTAMTTMVRPDLLLPAPLCAARAFSGVPWLCSHRTRRRSCARCQNKCTGARAG